MLESIGAVFPFGRNLPSTGVSAFLSYLARPKGKPGIGSVVIWAASPGNYSFTLPGNHHAIPCRSNKRGGGQTSGEMGAYAVR